MSEIRSIILSMSVTLIFFGTVSVLIPEGGLQKAFGTFRAVAVIAAVAMSVLGVSTAVSEFKASELELNVSQSNAELESAVKNSNVAAAEAAVKLTVTEACRENGIFNAEIEVSANIDSDNCISIVKVKAVCDKADMPKAESVISGLGLPVEVSERQ